MRTLDRLLEYLEQFAPLDLAADWDNVGLLLGDRAAEVERVLTCLTVTPDVAAEAVESGAQLIVTHHPVLFRAVKRLTSATSEGRMLLSLIRAGLRDFSISRTSFDWGVPIPWDPKHITYVWFDALTNYITAAGYGTDEERFARYWPALHLIGKDILRFHAVYWPAMLMAGGVEPPRQVFAHGFITVGGQKMSKTNATGIHPFELIDHFGVDAYRYYFLREIQFGQDGSFSWESMVERYNADLANGLGNLASRVLAMIDSYCDGIVPDPAARDDFKPDLVDEATSRYDRGVTAVDPTEALRAIWTVVGEANRYLVEREPWAMAKDPERRGDLEAVLYASAELLRIIAIAIAPVMPGAAGRLWDQLGIAEPLASQRIPESVRWGLLEPGTRIRRGDSLFPRLDD